MGLNLIHFLAGNYPPHFFRHFGAKSNGYPKPKKVDANPEYQKCTDRQKSNLDKGSTRYFDLLHGRSGS
jgi:hypothetical protein